MVLLGALIAVVTGIAYNAAAALQKHEVVQVDATTTRLLGQLLKRKAWLAATGLSLVAWVGQVASLALAPIALVVPLLAIGSALLVLLGVRFLHERFRAAELAGVALVAIGAAAAGAAEAGSTASRVVLSFWTQIVLAAIAVAGAAIVLRWKTGVAYGAASGLGFAAIAIYSKELGDRLAERGIAAIPHLFVTPTPYLLAVLSIAAVTLLQAGFQRANAASVVAALTVPEAIGPLIVGFALYHERYPHGFSAVLLPLGITSALTGSVLLARHGRKLGEPAGTAQT